MLTRLELDELFHPLPPLETARLSLLPFRVTQAAELFRVYSDPKVAAQTDEKPYETVEAVANYIAGILKRHEARAGLSWSLVSKDEQCIVGSVSLHSISWPNRRADLGFTLASNLWRRGLMAEALRCLIDFSFTRLRLIKLCAQNTMNNHGCHALLTRLGFEQEAVLRQHGYWNDRAHDLRQYGLVAAQRQ